MNARDELTGLIYRARWVDGIRDGALVSDAGLAEALIAGGCHVHRTITTTEELDALPHKSVVMTYYGDATTIHRNHPRLAPKHYHYLVHGAPATVLYEPEAES